MNNRSLLFLIVAIGLVYVFRLGEPGWYRDADSSAQRPPAYLFDESYTVFSASQLAHDDARFFEPARRYRYNGRVEESSPDPASALLSSRSRGEWSHPPGAPLVMSVAVRVFGLHAWSVRLVSLLAALAALLAVAKLANRGKLAALLLLATDGYFFIFARTAMPHMLLTSALVVGAALLDRVQHSSRRVAFVRALLAGACFGFAASVRWTAVPVVLAILVASMLTRAASRRLSPVRVFSILALALAVYVMTYAPYFAEGHSLADFFGLQRSMAWFHSHIDSPTGQASPWYRWPFALRGVVFGARGGDHPWLSIAAGNPVLWWLMPIALAWSLWRMKSSAKTNSAIVCAAAVIAVWLPWAILSRSGLSYYLLPAAPFAAVSLSQLLESQRARRPWLYRMCLVGSVMMFVGMYPVLSALDLTPNEVHTYRALFVASR